MIAELADRLGMSSRVKKDAPLPGSGFIVNDSAFYDMSDKRSVEYLSDEDISEYTWYMQIVYRLVGWIMISIMELCI